MDAERTRAVWDIELERLELNVIAVERLVREIEAVSLEPWTPPVLPGAMPVDLAARALDLLNRQSTAASQLREALARSQNQVAFAGHVIDITGRGPADPIYLDLEA